MDLGQHLSQEGLITFSVELARVTFVEESARKVVDQAKDFVAFAQTAGFDGGLLPFTGPGITERPPLGKTGLVAK